MEINELFDLPAHPLLVHIPVVLVPAALLAAGVLGAPAETRYTTSALTSHVTTNARVLERFLPVRIELSASGEVRVCGSF